MIIKMLYTIEIIQYEIKTRENGRICMTVLHTRYYASVVMCMLIISVYPLCH